MKVNSECHKNKTKLVNQIKQSIITTIDEQIELSARELKRFINREDGKPYFFNGIAADEMVQIFTEDRFINIINKLLVELGYQMTKQQLLERVRELTNFDNSTIKNFSDLVYNHWRLYFARIKLETMKIIKDEGGFDAAECLR